MEEECIDNNENIEGEETEDEEVKMNCIGGVKEVHDSDFSSESEQEQSDDEGETEENQSVGLVTFSGGKAVETETGNHIIRPQPERPIPEYDEGQESEASSDSSASSVGARGAPISFGDSNDDDESSVEEDEDDQFFSPPPDEGVEESLPEEPPILPRRSILQQLDEDSAKMFIQKAEKPVQCHTKRVLSSNTLAALNAEAGRRVDSPKRMRTSPEAQSSSNNPELPEFSLGLPALDENIEGGTIDTAETSSDEEEALDRALSEELKRASSSDGDTSPVPLLTPPQSPLNVPTGDGNLEWPSNLVVDSAMMKAATMTRTLSLKSLKDSDNEEDLPLSTKPDPSTLTPLLQSIYVGDN